MSRVPIGTTACEHRSPVLAGASSATEGTSRERYDRVESLRDQRDVTMQLRNLLRTGVMVLTILAASGCASGIMQSYVGKPMTEPVLDYGPPSAAFDMDATTRAFIWRMTDSYTVPGYIRTSGNGSASAFATASGGFASAMGSGIWTSNAIVQPAQDVSWSCNYALFARRAGNGISGPGGWIVSGYRKPSLACE